MWNAFVLGYVVTSVTCADMLTPTDVSLTFTPRTGPEVVSESAWTDVS